MTHVVNRFKGRVSGAEFFPDFVRRKAEVSGGFCSEPDALDYILESFRHEYLIRYGASDAARTAKRTPETMERHPAVRYMAGEPLDERSAQRYLKRGAMRCLNDFRRSYREHLKGTIFYDRETKTFRLRTDVQQEGAR